MIEAKSKVESMYGEAIRRDARTALESLGIEHGLLAIEDQGALPFVLLARIEAAVSRAHAAGALHGAKPAPIRNALPTGLAGARRASRRERFRRSRLYLPGNEPKFMLSAGLYHADAVILDLEDSVAPAEKDSARLLVRNALRVLDFGEAERMVRINPGTHGLHDLDAVVPQNVHLILIPKCESADEVRAVAERVREIQRGLLAGDDSCVLPEGALQPGEVFLMPIVETALGVERAYEIASAAPEVVGLTIGLEDYTADLGTQRTNEGRESFYARSKVVNAARAAGVAPIDSVFSDVADMDALLASVLEAKSLGFEGKGCIHPRQIDVIHRGFAPSPEELERAKRIVEAYQAAEVRGDGVVSLGSKMIDPPVVKRALRTVRLADGMAHADGEVARG
ncbi:MAG: aldolase/citrate lyase family protein [Candidatus Eisenbacteria bacterium]